MKRNQYFFLFLLFFSIACKSKDESSNDEANGPATSYLDAARNFIRAALDGNFTNARRYLLADSVNVNYMDVAERSYERADAAVRNGYRTSTIRIIDATGKPNDSTRIVIYSNTFKNDPDTLKIIRIDGQWLVDLKYLYLHASDTTVVQKPVTDSLK